MNGTDVQHTLREMWETRPARPRDDRKVAGVAAAIARRYDVDPVLVRVGFVVATFLGVGAALYLAGWLLLPDERGTDGTRPRLKVGKLLLVGIVAVAGFDGVSHGRALLPLAAVAALLFLLHRSRGGRGIVGPGAAGGSAPGTPAARTAGDTAVGAPAAVPPAWDPLGAAPFAWDLPEPGPAPAPPPAPRARVTPVTLALALLAGGVTALVLLVGGGLTDLPVLLGVVLAVLGGGLLIGAFTRSGRGLIPFALLACAITWGVLAAPLDRITSGPVEDLRLAPTTAAALAPRYDTGLGEVALDLRNMDLAVPPAPPTPPALLAPPAPPALPVATTIDTGVGDVEIWVPRDADVRFTGESGLGDVTFDGREDDGPGARLHVDDLGADGIAAGRPLVLTVQSGVGTWRCTVAEDEGVQDITGEPTEAPTVQTPTVQNPTVQNPTVQTPTVHTVDEDARTDTVLRTRRGPDPLALLVGLATLAMAVFAFVGELPDLSFVDPRWVLAGGAAAVGLALLVGNLRRRPGNGRH